MDKLISCQPKSAHGANTQFSIRVRACQVKQIEVQPGKRLSLQSHKFRAEHWFIVAGSGNAQIEENVFEIKSGQSIDVPSGIKHRISNTSREALIFIEVQTGISFDEDDIVRFEDDFGRV